MPLVDKRYAEALVDAAEAANTLDATKSELEVFAQLYREQADFRKFLQTPEISVEKKKSIIKDLFKESSSTVLPFLQVLLDKGRINNLPGIYKEYVDIADRRKKILHIDVKAATSLDDAQLAKIKEKYRLEYNATDVTLNVTIEPELLGGIIVKIGDKVIDGSIRGRLNGLKEATIRA